MPQCPRAPRHSYSADPSRLFVVNCDHCGASRDYHRKNHVSKYLKYRRTKRRDLGLLNVAAPLDAASASALTRAASKCGLVSSASGIPHVTYAEGLRPEAFGRGLGGAVEALRDAIKSEPTLTVVKIHSVPRRDGATDLIIADVAVERKVGDAAGRICANTSPPSSANKNGGAAPASSRARGGGRSWCALPQFPYHVALGACARDDVAKAQAAASKIMLGTELRIDAGRMKVLAPSDRRENGQGQGQGLPKIILQRRAREAVEDDISAGLTTSSTENDSEARFLEESKARDSTSAEEDDTASEDSTLPLVSPEDSDEDDPGLAVDLSFLDEAIPSPVVMRGLKPMAADRSKAALAKESPRSWQDPSGYGPVNTAPYMNVNVLAPPPPPPPRRVQAQNKSEAHQRTASQKDQQARIKRGSSKGRLLQRYVPGRRTQVAPIPSQVLGATKHPQAPSRPPPPPPPPPPRQQPPQPVPAPYDIDRPLYYHNNAMAPHLQQQAPVPHPNVPLAMYDQRPMYDPEQLYRLYNQPVAPQPYPVEGGYVTWVRVTPLTYQPLFVPNGGGGELGSGLAHKAHQAR